MIPPYSLQGLLKKVYQESCRILTLSQRRAAPSTQPHVSDFQTPSLSQIQHHPEDGSAPPDHQDKSLSNPPMSWQQEKRALQETVIALRELLCRMAQRHTEVNVYKATYRIVRVFVSGSLQCSDLAFRFTEHTLCTVCFFFF